jgi:hypothetical protein
MRKQPQHHHLPVIKSCLKLDQQLEWKHQGDEDDTANLSWSQFGDSLDFTAFQDCLTSTTTTTKTPKKVVFGGKARQKTTISLSQYTEKEYYNTWYTAEELDRMQQRRFRSSGFTLTNLATKRDRSSQNIPRYFTSKNDAKLMGLMPSSTKTNVAPPSGMARREDYDVEESSKSRRFASIFGRCLQQHVHAR